VLRLMPDRSTEEIFNGPGALTWHNAGPRQKNGNAPSTCPSFAPLCYRSPKVRRWRWQTN